MSAFEPVNRPHRPLPQPSTRIFGREQDVERLVHLLSRTDTRLLTLTGPGGVGKTRLALEVAHRLSDYVASKVHWVDLAAVRDAESSIAEIAATIGAQERNHQSLLATVIDELRNSRSLLLLDNIEQVTGLADLVAELIAACHGLSILSTGRTPLDLRAEQRYPVEPLAVPERDIPGNRQHPASLAAVRLFVERAQAVRPNFTLTEENATVIADICRRLDGLPLAIELAATQIELFNPPELLVRLKRRLPLIIDGAHDLPTRQQTMERTIAWSYDLLGEEEQALFRSLSVFVGGFTLPAACALRNSPVNPQNDIGTMRLVSALVRRSLLHQRTDIAGQERFRMLEMTRDFALERLQEQGNVDTVRHRQLRSMLDLAERADGQLSGPESGGWLARLEADHDNLRAAVHWAHSAHETARAAKLARLLSRFWYVRGHLSEGRATLERVLNALGDTCSHERVALLRALGTIAGAQGDARYETTLAHEALRCARETGDERSIAQSLQSCGNAARGQCDLSSARRYYTLALAILDRLDDQTGMAVVLNNLGLIAADQGDASRARTLFERSLAICERLESQRGLAIASCNLGNQLAETDGPRSALPYYRTALTRFRAIEDAAGVAWSLQAVATLANAEDETVPAARMYGAAEAARERIGWTFSAQERAEYDDSLVALRRQISEHDLSEAWAAGRELTIDAAIIESLSILAAIETRPPGPAHVVRDLPAGLSERETEILRLIATGLTNAEIAHRLRRSPHTVDAHVRRIFRKLNVQSRSAATRAAAEHNLL